jgi:fructokinase
LPQLSDANTAVCSSRNGLCLLFGRIRSPAFFPEFHQTSHVTAPPKHVAKERAPVRVALLGEALIDHFPETDVIGGAPFNVARNLAALGAAALMVTRVGEDADAHALLNEFTRFSLSHAGIQHDAQRATGNVQVTMKNGQPCYLIADNQAWDAIDSTTACRAVAAFQPDAICFGTLAQRHVTSRAAIREVVTASNGLKILDLNLRACDDNQTLSAWSLAHADIVKVNDDELAQLFAWFVSNTAREAAWGTDVFHDALHKLVTQFGIKRLVVTRGANGYAAFDDRGALIADGLAPRVDVIDTVGAGDAFLAAYLLGTLCSWAPAEALSEASAFAAAVCTLRGAVTSDATFYQPWRKRFEARTSSVGASAALSRQSGH